MRKEEIPPLSPLFKGGSETESPRRKRIPGVIFDLDSLHMRGLVYNGKHFPYNPDNIAKAQELRENMTPQERKLWKGFLQKFPARFLRQRPVDQYILDFYCAEYRLAIEIDGMQHFSECGKEYDRVRSNILSIYKIKVLRFSNKEIDEQFETVCRKISEEIPLVAPPPFQRGEAKPGGFNSHTN